MKSRSNKNLFTLFFLSFFCLCQLDNAAAQELTTKIKFRDNAAILSANDKATKMQIQIHTATEFAKTPYQISTTDTTFILEKVEIYRYEQFQKSDFPRLAEARSFMAAIEQQGNKLYVKSKSPYLSKKTLKPYMSEKGIEDYELIFEIPENSSISINHNGLSLGMMSVPLKLFSNPNVNLSDEAAFQSDPNAEPLNMQLLSVFNINAFAGIKFFSKNYSYIDSKEGTNAVKDKWSQNSPAISINTFLGMSRNRAQISRGLLVEDFNSLSYGLSLGIQYGPVVGFLSSGIDTHFADDFITDRFQNNLWIGFGIGLGI